MLNERNVDGVVPGSPDGARSARGGEPGAAAEVKRWSAGRKKEVVLRLLRGEPVDAISREVSRLIATTSGRPKGASPAFPAAGSRLP